MGIDSSTVQKDVTEVLGLCVGKDVFGKSDADHFNDGKLTHFVLLIKYIAQTFLSIRIMYFTRKLNEKCV